MRAAAACAIPAGWDGLDLSKIRMVRLGREIKSPTERDQVERNAEIADGVRDFCLRVRDVSIRDGGSRSLVVYVEDYAYGMGGSGAHKLAEMRGVAKDRLRALGFYMEPVNISSGRKTLLQKLPRADVKDFVERNVRRLKGETFYWTGDEIDAFCVANHGRMLLGLTHMSFLGA